MKTKKLLATVLSLCMIFTMLPTFTLTAVAAGTAAPSFTTSTAKQTAPDDVEFEFTLFIAPTEGTTYRIYGEEERLSEVGTAALKENTDKTLVVTLNTAPTRDTRFFISATAPECDESVLSGTIVVNAYDYATGLGYSYGDYTDLSYSEFYQDESNYKVVLPTGTASDAPISLNITTANDATVEYGGDTTLTNGIGEATATVTSADNSFSRTYTVNFSTMALKGEGSEDSPYLISTADELLQLAICHNSGAAAPMDVDGCGHGNHCGYYFKQTKNINMEGVAWEPIGHSGKTYFAGNFDGNGYTISNLTSTGKTNKSSYDCSLYSASGVFGWAAFGKISKVTVRDAQLSATGFGEFAYVGGLMGVAFACTVENCSVYDSKITSYRTPNNSNFAGGLVGTVYVASFDRCSSVGNTIKHGSYGGGLTGSNDDETTPFTNCLVADCTIIGYSQTSSIGVHSGAVMGSSQGGTTSLKNCFAYNCVTMTDETSLGYGACGIFSGYERDVEENDIVTSNTYYYDTNSTAVNDNTASAKTAEEFSNGTVLTLLGDAFIQGEKYPIIKPIIPAHTHAYTYELIGTDTIKSTCSADGCTNTGEQKITIVAPDNTTHTGSAITATLTGTIDGVTAPTIEYTATSGSLTNDVPVNVGTYKASITLGEGDNEVEASVTYSITAASIETAEVTLATNSGTFNNNPHTITPTVKLDTKALTTDDYDVKYLRGNLETSDLTSAGEITVQVTGKGNYMDTATQTATYTINKADASAVTTPTVNEAVDYGTKLSEISIGEWEWAAPDTVPTVTNSGYTATLTVTDDDNYDYSDVDGYDAEAHKITRIIQVTVNKKKIAVPAVPTTTYEYTGSEQTYALTSTADYKVENNKRTDAGEQAVTVTLTDTDNTEWAGSLPEYKFTIAKAPLTVTANDQSVKSGSTLPNTLTYTPSGLKGGDTINNIGVTFAIGYEKNGVSATPDISEEGSYDIVVSYTGEATNYEITCVKGTLTITEKDAQTVTADDVTLTYGDEDGAIEASAIGALSYEVSTGADVITVDNEGNITILKAGTATVKITAAESGTYAEGTKTITVNVDRKDIAGAIITLGEALTFDGTEQTQTIASVKTGNLDVTYDAAAITGNKATNHKADGSYTLTVTGNGNFTGTATKEWNIAQKDILDAVITLGEALTYSGVEQTQTIASVKIGNLDVTYDAAAVTGNKETNHKADGSYTLTVTGNGNFTGTASQNWNIAKKPISNTIILTAPVKNAVPQTEITGDGYTATVVWSPEVTDKFKSSTEYTATITITVNGNHTIGEIAENGYVVEGAKSITNAANSNEITVAFARTGSSGGGGSSSTSTTTTKNDDGSTTKTTTNKVTGTTTEVTTNTDGSTMTVETKKDGTVTTTEKDKEGNTTTTVENPDGTSTTTEKTTDGTTTVTEKDADGTTTTTETDKAGNKTVTTGNTDGSTVTEETKKDGTKVVTETNSDGETSATVETKKETEVTIPVENADEVTKVVVTDKDGNKTEAEFTVTDGGVAITVDGNVAVSVQTGHICYAKDFTDVDLAAWYHENVCYVLSEGLMKGTATDKFEPNANLTRAMLVTILYRAEGEPATNRSIPFFDVDMGSWYASAVIWTQQNGIVKGVSETEFAPNDNITREQIAAILYRYAIYKGMDAVNLSENLGFADADEISEYAISAMNWAVGNGLIKGYENNTVRPLNNATRAEAAALLQRFLVNNK